MYLGQAEISELPKVSLEEYTTGRLNQKWNWVRNEYLPHPVYYASILGVKGLMSAVSLLEEKSSGQGKQWLRIA